MHLEIFPTPVDTLVKGQNTCNNKRAFKITGPLCIKINFNTQKFEFKVYTLPHNEIGVLIKHYSITIENNYD
jgi:hypothetical protein